MSTPIEAILTGPLVKRFSVNECGRDFVVGDLHGAFDLLDLALERAGFDAEIDRLFSVGDLVDRGPDSAQALELLRRPYFHAVIGNHEYAFLRMSPAEVILHAKVNFHGMGWAKSLSTDRILEIQAEMRKCPVAMQIQTRTGSVGVVHADVPEGMCWREFTDRLGAGGGELLASALEGRARAMDVSAMTTVEGVDRVFVGHTPMLLGAQRRGNVWIIDTGAVFRQEGVVVHGFDDVAGMLTLVNVEASHDDLDRFGWNSAGETAVVDVARERMRA